MEKTLRDEIAIAALSGILANPRVFEAVMLMSPGKVHRHMAGVSYDYADAMLAERDSRTVADCGIPDA